MSNQQPSKPQFIPPATPPPPPPPNIYSFEKNNTPEIKYIPISQVNQFQANSSQQIYPGQMMQPQQIVQPQARLNPPAFKQMPMGTQPNINPGPRFDPSNASISSSVSSLSDYSSFSSFNSAQNTIEQSQGPKFLNPSPPQFSQPPMAQPPNLASYQHINQPFNLPNNQSFDLPNIQPPTQPINQSTNQPNINQFVRQPITNPPIQLGPPKSQIPSSFNQINSPPNGGPSSLSQLGIYPKNNFQNYQQNKNFPPTSTSSSFNQLNYPPDYDGPSSASQLGVYPKNNYPNYQQNLPSLNTSSAAWAFYSQGISQEFSKSEAEIIEKAYNENKEYIILIQNDGEYLLDLKNFRRRKLERISEPITRMGSGLSWKWMNEDGNWWDYSAENIRIIEKAYKLYRQGKGGDVVALSDPKYQVNLKTFKQVNVGSSFERGVKRLVDGFDDTLTDSNL